MMDYAVKTAEEMRAAGGIFNVVPMKHRDQLRNPIHEDQVSQHLWIRETVFRIVPGCPERSC